jgi:hypothetical protein
LPVHRNHRKGASASVQDRAKRQYAEKQQTSLNAIIRTMLEQTVRPQSEAWLEEAFKLMDRANGNSNGQSWTREDLYHG